MLLKVEHILAKIICGSCALRYIVLQENLLGIPAKHTR